MTTITTTQIHADGLDQTRFTITDEHGTAAELAVTTDHGLVLSIETREDRRREGLATALYEYAATVMDIYHVPVWGRTHEGQAIVEHIDGEVMDDAQAAEILGLDLAVVAPEIYYAA